MHERLRLTARCLVASCGLLLSAAAAPDEVVVICNVNNSRSEELARYYMEQRGIPGDHLCRLDLPLSEGISRTAYEKRLRDPLLAFLREGGFIDQLARRPDTVRDHETSWITTRTSVRYLASVYGVPLRIRDTRTWLTAKLADTLKKPGLKDAAAVDSELSLLLVPPYATRGAVANPVFGRPAFPDRKGPGRLLLAATRLDGPEPELVKRMIDDALLAERYGVPGRACIDENAAPGDYGVGDRWLQGAAETLARQGYPVARDSRPAEWGNEVALDDAAFYFGWYSRSVAGPFTRETFRFPRGAVACHIYSGSAASLRQPGRHWATTLLERGAAATMGAVDEPFLHLTPHLDRFVEYLADGATFADSAYASMTHLSWQITIIGDPLYRPFRYTLDRQLRHLQEDERPPGEIYWAHVRKIEKLRRRDRTEEALAYARTHLGLENLPDWTTP